MLQLMKNMRVRYLTLLLVLFPLLIIFFPSAPVYAQGIALSGSFYRQEFELPQGSKLSAPGVYVVAFNNGTSDFRVKMVAEVPFGVNISFSSDDFLLKGGEQKRVTIAIEVSPDAVPGEYELKVIAESYTEGQGGIKLLGAAGQSAPLTIVGEVANLEVVTAASDGTPVVAVIRLYKLIDDERYDFGYSETGKLSLKLSPGDYVTQAYIAGEKLAEESFSIMAGEEKKITLVVKTIYFEGFGIVPNYHTKTGALAFAEVVYTINNLYQSIPEARVVLKVTKDSAPFEESILATLTPLERGRVSLNYSYIPRSGWQEGEYSFKLELYISGELYIMSPEERLEVTMSKPFAWWLVIVVAVIVIAGLSFLVTKRRRRA